MALFLVGLAPLHAAATEPYLLPPTAEVRTALDAHPLVRAAQAQLGMAQAEQHRRDSGEYEFTLRGGSYEDYFFQTNGNEGYRDWEIALERPFRLPNKMWLDQEIGAEGVEQAESGLGDARHEAARTLLKLWFDCLREQAQVRQWQQQVDILTQQAAMTEKRIRAGDAPRMELNQVNAVLALARVSWQQASLRVEVAERELHRQFPSITLPADQPASEPSPIVEPLAYWRDIILKHNHELEMMQAAQRKQEKLAQRARADTLPDPTLGVRYASQLNGNQRISGVYFSIPLPSGARTAAAETTQHSAALAAGQTTATLARLEADIHTAYTEAVRNYQIWQLAREATLALQQNAELTARAYNLGELSLAETLIARRQALDAQLTANLAQLDAHQARYRLLLDAHQLWADNSHHEAHP